MAIDKIEYLFICKKRLGRPVSLIISSGFRYLVRQRFRSHQWEEERGRIRECFAALLFLSLIAHF